jgi:hypothetical protein
MSELLGKLNGGELIGLCAAVGGLLVAAIAVITHQWRRVRVAEIEATLKQQMLDKGMTAADIEQVMMASRRPASSSGLVIGEDSTPDQGSLMALMVEGGYEATDIERVIRAFQELPGGSSNLTRDRALVVRKMIEHEHEAGDIERVLRAFQPADSAWKQQLAPASSAPGINTYTEARNR